MAEDAGKIQKLLDPFESQRVAVNHAEPRIEAFGHRYAESLSRGNRVDRVAGLDIGVHAVSPVGGILNATQQLGRVLEEQDVAIQKQHTFRAEEMSEVEQLRRKLVGLAESAAPWKVFEGRQDLSVCRFAVDEPRVGKVSL